MSSQSERGLDKSPKHLYHLFLLLLEMEELRKAVTPKPEKYSPYAAWTVLVSILIPPLVAALKSPGCRHRQRQHFWYFPELFDTPVKPIDSCRYAKSTAVEIHHHCAAFQTWFEKYQDSKKVV